MTGAEANAGWLNRRVTLDAKGFIKMGPDLTTEDLAAAQWPLERAPYLLETSRPGVFVVGDVRCGNVKRVASAVGEGSIAISFLHRVLPIRSTICLACRRRPLTGNSRRVMVDSGMTAIAPAFNVAAFAGSLRRGSYNRALLRETKELARRCYTS